MARCGCTSSQCNCVIQPGPGATVTGNGSPTDPYVIGADAGHLVADDSPTVDHTLTGTGTAADPYHLSSAVKISAVDGNILTAQPDGLAVTCDDVNACITPGGPIVVDCGLEGAGTAASPFQIKGLSAWPYPCPEVNGNNVYCGADGSLLVDPPPVCQNFQVGLGAPIPFSGFCGVIATDGARHRFSTQPNRLVVNNPSTCKPMLVDIRGSAVIFIDGDGDEGTDGGAPEGNWINQILHGVIFNGATGPAWQQVGISGRGRLDYRIDAFQLSVPPGGALTLGSWFDGQADVECHVDGASVQHANIIAFGRTC